MAAAYLSPRPRAFTALALEDAAPERLVAVIRDGRPGTAMMPFSAVLSDADMTAVAAFIRDSFVVRRQANTRYHTAANGWDAHERYAAAFPFALGEVPVDAPEWALDDQARAGLKLFLSACITCHESARRRNEDLALTPRAVSFPRGRYSHREPVDAVTAATPYRRHEIPPALDQASSEVRLGETLFQANCAYCHAPDGTGGNWVGRFLDPSPRDLTDGATMAGLDRERLRDVIRQGIPGTTMPAWRSVLSEAQIDAIIAYIDQVFYPVGK